MRLSWIQGGRLLSVILVTGLLAGCEIKKVPRSASSQSDPASSNSDAAADSASSKAKASETIGIEGSSTVYPICQAFAVEFEKKTQHKISVGRQGTGGGYKKFANRQADIWNASRPIDAKEIDELKAKGIEWLELKIAVDGIVIAVHPENTWCTRLTCAQLKQIWEPDSKIEKWSDLDSTWPSERIQLYGADTDSGTFEYFTEVINGVKKASNTRYTPASDDNILVTGIAANKMALGYIPFGYYVENTEKLSVIGVSASKVPGDTAAKYVVPTEESILSGEYAPLSRPLFMYVSITAIDTRPEVGEFLQFAISDEAQPLVKQRGFVPLKDDVLHQMQDKLGAALRK